MLQGYLLSTPDTYAEPSPGDALTTLGETAWYTFRRDGQPTEQESGGRSRYPRHLFEVQQPPYWRAHRGCMVKRSCQVSKREIELEGLDVLDALRMASDGGEAIPLTSHMNNYLNSSFV